MTASDAKRALNEFARPNRAAALRAFFRCEPGGYGAPDDRFIGVTVPQVRSVVRQFRLLDVDSTTRLVTSPVHEERLLGLLIWVDQAKRGDAAFRKTLFKHYMDLRTHINNWDLIDSSAEHLVGPHLRENADPRKPMPFLTKLARSPLWHERRIAVLATFHFIRCNEFEPTIVLARQLMTDPHDLLHKAVGWLLREIGKRDAAPLHIVLAEHAHEMPRTMLRYAIEKLPEKQRQSYLRMKAERTKEI